MTLAAIGDPATYVAALGPVHAKLSNAAGVTVNALLDALIKLQNKVAKEPVLAVQRKVTEIGH